MPKLIACDLSTDEFEALKEMTLARELKETGLPSTEISKSSAPLPPFKATDYYSYASMRAYAKKLYSLENSNEVKAELRKVCAFELEGVHEVHHIINIHVEINAKSHH